MDRNQPSIAGTIGDHLSQVFEPLTGMGWWLLNILNARHKDGTRQIADVLQPGFHQHHSERSTASAVSLDSRTSRNGNCCPIRLELGLFNN